MKIGKRTLLLFLLGVMLYAFPWIGVPLSKYRILGVLQRIALCYGIGSILCLKLNRQQIIGVSAAFLLGYWFLLLGYGDFSLENNAVRHLDLLLFGDSHLYHGDGIAFDPEGLLSTLPSIATFTIGYLVGQYIGETADSSLIIRRLSIAASALMFAGVVWDIYFPINKKLWTSSFVLLAAGLSLAIFLLVYYVADVLKRQKGSKFFVVFGTNAILAYLVSEYLIMIMTGFVFTSNGANGQEATFHLFSGLFGATAFASLLWSLAYVGVCWLIVYLFYRKNIFLKV